MGAFRPPRLERLVGVTRAPEPSRYMPARSPAPPWPYSAAPATLPTWTSPPRSRPPSSISRHPPVRRARIAQLCYSRTPISTSPGLPCALSGPPRLAGWSRPRSAKPVSPRPSRAPFRPAGFRQLRWRRHPLLGGVPFDLRAIYGPAGGPRDTGAAVPAARPTRGGSGSWPARGALGLGAGQARPPRAEALDDPLTMHDPVPAGHRAAAPGLHRPDRLQPRSR
jgi:hypothetical protein